MPKVSVIIPVYNSTRYLSESIESALKQTYQDFEIITVDDGSEDNSKSIIENYIEKYPNKIRYIYQSNKGIAGARNTGIRNAKGEFIALLDADDAWLPQRLEAEVKIIETSVEIGLVHADFMEIDEEGKPLGNFKKENKYLSGHIFEPLFLRKADIASATVLFRKSCSDKVGYFDEDRACMGCDDRDLWLRIAQKYRIEYVNKVLAHHRTHAANYGSNTQKMFEARVYVINKFFPGKNRLKSLALAKILRDLGDDFLYKQMFIESRKQYLKAISLFPFYLWAWVNFIKACLKIKVKKDELRIRKL